MKKTLAYMALGIFVVFATGCSKKLGEFSSDYFSTNPTPLSPVGNNVPATVTGNIPRKFMVKNAEVTITPELRFADGTVAGQPVLVQGENARANGQTVSYDNGGTIVIPFNVAYQPAMDKSDLYLNFYVQQNNKTYQLPAVKVRCTYPRHCRRQHHHH